MDEQVGAWLGLGNYVGEVKRGPDGELFEWVEGVDGLGYPFGFWKSLRRAVGKGIGTIRRAARLPGVKQLLPMASGLVPGGAAAMKAAQTAGLLGAPPGDYMGEVRAGPDGSLYQWEEGVDGLGNPFGFWKAIRGAVGKAVGAARRYTPAGLASRYLPQAVRALGPHAAKAMQAARAAGLTGEEDYY